MTVRRLLASMTSEELSEWMAYYRLQGKELEQRRTERELEATAQAGAAKRLRRMKGRR